MTERSPNPTPCPVCGLPDTGAADEGSDNCIISGGDRCVARGYQRVSGLLEQSRGQVSALYEAVKYTLDRSQTDPDLGYYLGPGMQAFFLLCKAEAALTGKPLAEVEAARRRDLQPAHRKREPEVLELRRRLEEAQRD